MVLRLQSCKRFCVPCRSRTLAATCSCSDETVRAEWRCLHLAPSDVFGIGCAVNKILNTLKFKSRMGWLRFRLPRNATKSPRSLMSPEPLDLLLPSPKHHFMA